MEDKPLHIVTGASGGIGQALTERLAKQGYRVLMACRNPEKSEPILTRIRKRSGNPEISLLPLDLGSLDSIARFAAELRARGQRIDVLLNNAGTMNGTFGLTADGFERTVGVNCVGTAALTLSLLPLMHPGSRIVNTLSCTYRIGRVDGRLLEPDPEHYARFRTYGTSKLALLLFSLELRERVARQGIGVFAADPGIVDTNMITMHRWFDPIADLLFRPLIKTPEQGAETALQLACGKLPVSGNDLYWRNGKARRIPDSIVNHPCRKPLWEQILQPTIRAVPDTETYFRSLKY